MATRDLWRTRGYNNNEPRYNDYNYDRHYQNNYPRPNYQRASYRDESNFRTDRQSDARHYPRYDYKESYYFQRHRSRDRTRRNSHRASHRRTRTPRANYSRHERKYSRDYRRSPNTRRAPSARADVLSRAESRVDSRYAEQHDSEGHVLVNLGGDLTPRYKQLAVVGEGTFGKVLECWDRDTREHVAVKVIRAVPKYRDAAMIEIRIFDQLHAIDPQHNSGIIHLKRWFDYCNHVCMVFPLCGTSLFDYMRNNQFQPLYLPVIRSIARQLFTSLAALHRHGIIHTDLKPENLLFRDTRMTPVNVEQRVQHEWGPVQSDTCQSPLTATQVLSPELVVVDFGSAVARTDHRSRVVGTRHYRAPEVMWEAHRTGNKKHDNVTWGQEVDVWAVGCILIELWMGDPLFRTRHNHDHLLMMQRVLGAFPSHWMSRDQVRRFEQDRALYQHLQSLEKLIVIDDEPLTLEFFRLIRATLEYDPARRISAAQALEHPFFALHVDYTQYFRRVLHQQHQVQHAINQV